MARLKNTVAKETATAADAPDMDAAIAERQEALAARPTPPPQAAPAPAAKKQSPKAKSSLGIPGENKITWVAFDTSAEVNATINRAAVTRNLNVGAMLASMLKRAVEADMDAIKADAAAYEPASRQGKTAERLAAMTTEQQEVWFRGEQARIVRMLMSVGKSREEAAAMVAGMAAA